MDPEGRQQEADCRKPGGDRESLQGDLVGKTLIHYRITGRIGSGGMGVVYRAEDTHLRRPVAIKLLPGTFSRDPDRLARFEREACLLATLNHPNVASVYGLEEVEQRRFLIMELIDGTSLRERLDRGPISIEKVLDIGRQIAEGLESAHDRGIVHRDLQPANIQLTSAGRVKILDFGLAKTVRSESEGGELNPGESQTMTTAGAILGTAGYMSPEQARGEAVDRRADIWAFGCVLYECLTGQRAFQGKSLTEALLAILQHEPDWDAIPESAPPGLKDLLRRCLAKDPGERPQRIADVRTEIERLRSGESLPGERRFLRSGISALLFVPIIVLLMAAAVWLFKYGEILFPPDRIDSIAVLPLSNLSGDPEQEYFADGMTEAATDRSLWAKRFERDLTSILSLQAEVAQAVARQIETRLKRAEEGLLARPGCAF